MLASYILNNAPQDSRSLGLSEVVLKHDVTLPGLTLALLGLPWSFLLLFYSIAHSRILFGLSSGSFGLSWNSARALLGLS